jgi:hypothetical protein
MFFNVGDKVSVYENSSYFYGKVGTVMEYDDLWEVLMVKFKDEKYPLPFTYDEIYLLVCEEN